MRFDSLKTFLAFMVLVGIGVLTLLFSWYYGHKVYSEWHERVSIFVDAEHSKIETQWLNDIKNVRQYFMVADADTLTEKNFRKDEFVAQFPWVSRVEVRQQANMLAHVLYSSVLEPTHPHRMVIARTSAPYEVWLTIDMHDYMDTAVNTYTLSKNLGLLLSRRLTSNEDKDLRLTIVGRPNHQGTLFHSFYKKTFAPSDVYSLEWLFDARSLGGFPWHNAVLIGLVGLFLVACIIWLFVETMRMATAVQKQVNERTMQLEHVSRRFRLITDNAYDLIVVTDTQGRIEYVNSAYQRILGFARENMQLQPIYNYLHTQDQVQLRKVITNLTQGKNPEELLVRMRDEHGKWHLMEAVAKGLHDPDWCITNVVIHCRDITAKQTIVDSLALSEQRFKDFAVSSADWLWEVDDKLNFTYVSPGVSKVLNFTPEELHSKHQLDYLFEDENDPTRHLIENRIQRHQAYREIEFWTRAKDDARVCLRVSGIPIFDDQHKFVGYRGAATNITASKTDRERMLKLATTDHLTGLLNRVRFMEELDRSVNLAKRHGTQGVVMFIDLDRFKEINDTHGHEAGDKILLGIADILQESVRSTDVVARLGGDEFGVIMHNIDPSRAQAKMQKVIDKINLFSVTYNSVRLNVTMSIGMVVYPQDEKDSDNLIMSADLAMYRAKDMGRNRMYIDAEDASAEQKDSVRTQLKWVERLRTCLETGDFEMHFQPIVPVKKRKRPLFEALLRIYDEDGNIGSPALYIDAAEHFGLIQQLDISVIKRCVSAQAEMMAKGVDVDISINLSSRTLGDPEVTETLRNLTKQFTIDPSRIIFEVTETIALHDPSAMRDLGEIHAFVSELRRMGFRFALDDFGSGFSSFSYLRVLQVDVIKIDGNYVKDIETCRNDYLFVKSITDLATGLGIQVIAEFVENENILNILDELGVDYAQGYHIAKPQAGLSDLVKEYSGKTFDNYRKNKIARVEYNLNFGHKGNTSESVKTTKTEVKTNTKKASSVKAKATKASSAKKAPKKKIKT